MSILTSEIKSVNLEISNLFISYLICLKDEIKYSNT